MHISLTLFTVSCVSCIYCSPIKQPIYTIVENNNIHFKNHQKQSNTNNFITEVIVRYNDMGHNEAQTDDQDMENQDILSFLSSLNNDRTERETEEETEKRGYYNSLDNTIDDDDENDESCNNAESNELEKEGENEEEEKEKDNNDDKKDKKGNKKEKHIKRKVRQVGGDRQYVVGTFQAIMQSQPEPSIPILSQVQP